MAATARRRTVTVASTTPHAVDPPAKVTKSTKGSAGKVPAARAVKQASKDMVGATRPPGVRELAAQATREAILRAATKVFAKQGFAGGRVEQISKAARSYDRMIYYYFGSKEGLFIAVIEEAYRRFNEAESKLVLDEAQPVESLTAMIRFVWGYYQKNPEFITLLNTENLHRGVHIGKSLRAADYSSPAISLTARILEAGAVQGRFRRDVAARDVYLMIAAMGYFYLSNRYTLSAFLGEQLETPAAMAHWETFLIDAVLRTLNPASPPTPTPTPTSTPSGPTAPASGPAKPSRIRKTTA